MRRRARWQNPHCLSSCVNDGNRIWFNSKGFRWSMPEMATSVITEAFFSPKPIDEHDRHCMIAKSIAHRAPTPMATLLGKTRIAGPAGPAGLRARPVPVAGPRHVCPAPVTRCRVLARSQQADKKSTSAQIVIQAKGTTVTPAMRDHAMEKVASCVHNFEVDVKEVDVHMFVRSKEQGHHGRDEHTVELVAYTLRNGTLRVQDTQDNMYAAVDSSCHKLKGVLSKTKEKAMQRGTWPGHAEIKGGAKLAEVMAAQEEDD